MHEGHKRLQVGIDTNVLLRAVLNGLGDPRRILYLGEWGELQLVISREVDNEIYEKVRKIIPAKIQLLPMLLARSGIQVLPPPSVEHLNRCTILVPDPDDVEIVAAMWTAQVDYFVSEDRKHLVRNAALIVELPFPVGTADTFLSWYRAR